MPRLPTKPLRYTRIPAAGDEQPNGRFSIDGPIFARDFRATPIRRVRYQYITDTTSFEPSDIQNENQ